MWVNAAVYSHFLYLFSLPPVGGEEGGGGGGEEWWTTPLSASIGRRGGGGGGQHMYLNRVDNVSYTVRSLFSCCIAYCYRCMGALGPYGNMHVYLVILILFQ